jgi:hypothetical protein
MPENGKDFKALIQGGELSRPYTIRTRGDKKYTITAGSEVFAPVSHPETLILCLPKRGIILLAVDEIDSIQHET